MHLGKRILSLALTLALLLSMFALNIPAAAAEDTEGLRPMEYLTRGLVATKLNTGVYLSWRFLGDEPDGISWNIYRDGAKIATVEPRDVQPESNFSTNPGIVKEGTTPTNYTDAAGLATSVYEVAPVIDGVEGVKQGQMLPMLSLNNNSGANAGKGAAWTIPIKTNMDTNYLPQFEYRGVATGPVAGTHPNMDGSGTSTTGQRYYTVDMDLLRGIREPYEAGTPVEQSVIDASVTKLNSYLADLSNAWQTVSRDPLVFTGSSLADGKVTKEFYDAFEAKFFEYVDWLDAGPKLGYKKNPNGSIALTTSSSAYYPRDTTVGDFDGDGEYEIVCLMTSGGAAGADPYQNDPMMSGASIVPPGYIDVYKLDGTLLFRVDIGMNVMINNDHQPMLFVQDFDGDGMSELMLKSNYGTRVGNWDATANNVVYSNDPSTVVGGEEGLKATREAIKQYADAGDTASLDKYWNMINSWSISYFNPTRNGADANPYTQKKWIKSYHIGYNGSSEGTQESFSAFKYDTELGKGILLDSAPYPHPYDNVKDPNYGKFGKNNWGVAPMTTRGAYSYNAFDNPSWRTGPSKFDPNEVYWLENPWGYYPWGDPQGNRSSRYVGTTLYADGSYLAVSSRGYYHRTTHAAFNIVDGKVVNVANFDSADPDYWRDSEDWYMYQNRGNHQQFSGDVNGDGNDEIVMSAMTLELQGDKFMPIAIAGGIMPSLSTLPAASGPANGQVLMSDEIQNNPANTWWPLRHGDRSQFLAADKTNKLVYWSCREENFIEDLRDGHLYGFLPASTVHDPATGEVIQGVFRAGGADWDSGTAGNFTNRYPGTQGSTVSGGAMNLSTGAILTGFNLGSGTPIWWDGDLVHENISGANVNDINDSSGATVTNAANNGGYTPTGGTSGGLQKSTPMLKADLFGDWREEYIMRSNTHLYIYTSAMPTEYGIRTLMHDPMYRNGVSDMHVGYNQGGNASFYLGDEAELPAMRTDITIPNPFAAAIPLDYGNGETGLLNATIGLPYGDLPAPERIGFTFIGWSLDGTAEGLITSATIVQAGDQLTAIWEVDPRVYVSLKGTPIATLADEAEYIISVANAKGLATVTLWLEVDGAFLSGLDAEGLIEGFGPIGGIAWTNTEGTTYVGRVTIGALEGEPLTTVDYVDLFKLNFGLKAEGDTVVKIKDIKLSGYDEAGTAVFFDSVIKNDTAGTEIGYPYSIYDLNKDKVVDQLDLTIAQKYYMAAEGDANWDESKIADVNGSGTVDIEDFIMIMNNIVW